MNPCLIILFTVQIILFRQLFYFILLMSLHLASSSKQTHNNNTYIKDNDDGFAQSDVHLNAEILRIQSTACAKQIEHLYQLDTDNTLKFLAKQYKPLPISQAPPSALYGKIGVRVMKTQSKIYFGQVKNKRKHGRGIIIYRQGRIYQGEFYQNQKNGMGCQLYANGNLYIGQFSQNKKHGSGSFYWFNLCQSACTKDSGTSIQQFHGSWWGGLPDGYGQHTKSNGDHYIGNFKNGLKHGQGEQKFANGDVYKGEYLNGLPQGYGHYIWKDKSQYKGDFKQGYRNGYGIWMNPRNQQKYQGHFLLDRKHGYGVFDWEKLDKQYRGNYIQDMRTGQGELYEKGKLVYKGFWQNGKQIEQFQPINEFTPPKTMRQKNNKTLSTSQFRVKTAKVKINPCSRNVSASTTKKNYEVKFVHDDNRSCHRGCVACKNRPKLGQYSQKKMSQSKTASYC